MFDCKSPVRKFVVRESCKISLKENKILSEKSGSLSALRENKISKNSPKLGNFFFW